MNESLRREGVLISIVGPTASGKSTICERLCSEFSGSLSRSVSATSRPKRSGERDGEDYFFVTCEEFKRSIESGMFFEWEEVHGNLYGTPRANVEQALAEGRDLLLAIDIRGAFTLKAKLPKHAVLVFLLPPSHRELVSRLTLRAPLPADEYKARMHTLREEYAALRDALQRGGGVDYIVVNDQLDAAYEKVRGIVLAERSRAQRIVRDAVEELTATE
jgi:guanylate kinase